MNWAKVTCKIALRVTAVAGLALFANAQTFTVLHNFTGGDDGGQPYGGVTLGPGHSLYGTGLSGGASGQGVVFKLTNAGSGWVLDPLYSFQGGNDGARPTAGVIIGPDGALYGTTAQDGGCFLGNCGTVFKLRPAADARGNALGQWTETVLYHFTGTNGDGSQPGTGNLYLDAAGNLYGTTFYGGSGSCNGGCGVVFELSPSSGGWTENILYSFTGASDGASPEAGVILDSAGNLYGTCTGGGVGYGTVYQLTPSGSAWTENTLYAFTGSNDGSAPEGGVIFDQTGNLAGTAAYGGSGNGGTAFELSPSSGGWNYSLMYSLNGNNTVGPIASLAIDTAGNLYGTTLSDGAYGYGSVFELTPSQSGWIYTDLHDFQGGSNDGASPSGVVALDVSGNLYGTTISGGTSGYGVVWEITSAANLRHPGKAQPHRPVHDRQ